MPAQANPPAPTWLEIDLTAVRHNVKLLLSLVPSRTKLIAVVKADAYGHGAVEVARAAVEAGASALAVARVAEGLHLRRAGMREPVIVLGPFVPAELTAAIQAGLELTVSGPGALAALSSASLAAGATAAFHLKVDTGMHRYGVPPADAGKVLRLAEELPCVRAAGIYTHFATADDPEHPGFENQLRSFRRCMLDIERAGLRPPLAHAANSAAAVRGAPFDAVRPGIALYGVQPLAGKRVDIKAVMSVKAVVSHALDVSEGEGVSYGHVYVAPTAQRALVVPCGYADGYTRSLGGRAEVLIGGERCAVLGRVTMDSIVVAAPRRHPVRLGEEVVLMGTQDEHTVTAEELGQLAGTIPYEILTGMGRRSPRLFLG